MLLFVLSIILAHQFIFLHVYTGDREAKSKTMCLNPSQGDSKGEPAKSHVADVAPRLMDWGWQRQKISHQSSGTNRADAFKYLNVFPL